jgi:alpha-glucosidase
VAAAHNAYATEWARLNLEAVQESGRAGEVLFFSRSGFTRSPGHAPLFWLGDQTVTWDDRDGIKTVVTGMLNGGFSGFAITHSDIGGYTAVDQPGLRYHRSAELLLRWAELNAFTPVFRTHEGNLPQVNHQFDSDRDTLVRFGRYARMYRALGDYRRRLFQEAWERGWPVVRHMFLHYPQDVEAAALDRQFLLGRDLLVAPVLDPGRTQVRVYVPEPGWRHVWSDAEVPPGWQLVDAPLGQPAVFYRAASRGAASAARALRAAARD